MISEEKTEEREESWAMDVASEQPLSQGKEVDATSKGSRNGVAQKW